MDFENAQLPGASNFHDSLDWAYRSHLAALGTVLTAATLCGNGAVPACYAIGPAYLNWTVAWNRFMEAERQHTELTRKFDEEVNERLDRKLEEFDFDIQLDLSSLTASIANGVAAAMNIDRTVSQIFDCSWMNCSSTVNWVVTAHDEN
jgi:hypothetical protein